MAVLPVTNTDSSGIPSLRRLCLAPIVGAKWMSLTIPASFLLISSGKGAYLSPVLSPASTWPHGIFS